MTAVSEPTNGTANQRRERSSQLTPQEVVTIRQRYASDPTLTYRELASQYEKSTLAIGQAIRGETWAELPGALRDNTARSRRKRKRPQHAEKLTSDLVYTMLKDYNTNTNLTYNDLMRQYGLGHQVIERAFRSLPEWLTPEQIAEVGYPKRAVRGARRGERHPLASLTDEQVKNMRTLRAENPEFWTLRRLATIFGVCESMVSRVVRGMSRRDAGGPISA